MNPNHLAELVYDLGQQTNYNIFFVVKTISSEIIKILYFERKLRRILQIKEDIDQHYNKKNQPKGENSKEQRSNLRPKSHIWVSVPWSTNLLHVLHGL